MTSMSAIVPFDGAAAPIPKAVASMAGEAFSDLLGAVGDELDAVPAVDAEGTSAQAAAATQVHGVVAALAAMLASVTTIKGRDRAPPQTSEEEHSQAQRAPREPPEADPTAGAEPAPVIAILAAPVASAGAAGMKPAAAASPRATSASLQAGAGGRSMPAAAAAIDQALQRALPHVDCKGAAVTAENGPPADTPAPGKPWAAVPPADPVLRALASLAKSDDRPSADEPQPAKFEISPVTPTSNAFIQSIAVPVPEATTSRGQTPAIDRSISHHLDLAREGEWLDQLAGEIARTAGSSGTLRFRLHPEALGRLHVEMSQSAVGASIRLTTDTETARTIIADAQPRLVAEARAQGVRIAETHVALGAGGQWSAPGQQGQRETAHAFVRTSGPGSAGGTSGEPPASRAAHDAEERYA